MNKKIHTDKAPAAIGPYSQAVRAGDLLFVSGQIPLDAETGAMVEGGVEAQAHQVFKNIGAILQSEGLSFNNVAKATVLLADMGDFAAVNAIYAQYFNGDVLPARAAFAVKELPKAALVEIEVVAGY